MLLSDFDYQLPDDRIAKFPPKVRGTTRLLVLNKQNGTTTHRKYSDLIDYLETGDVLVLNDTKVIKARLIAHPQSGKSREFLLLENHTQNPDPHTALALTFGKCKVGEKFYIQPHCLIATKPQRLNNQQLTTNHSPQITITATHPGGTVTISSSSNLNSLADSFGQVPLPPYLNRLPVTSDTTRYQTIFAKTEGSVAAPTASLNLTRAALQKIQNKGVKIAYLTLHVGLGTFQPIRTNNLKDHHMHSEWFHLPADTIQAIKQAKASGHKITAVGTTVTRTLEYITREHPNIFNTKYQIPNTNSQLSGEANIFIYPGYKFQIVDQLLTNFHAPKSTVLMMAAAFSGWPYLKSTYQEALSQNYNFLSYGDSMLIIQLASKDGP